MTSVLRSLLNATRVLHARPSGTVASCHRTRPPLLNYNSNKLSILHQYQGRMQKPAGQGIRQRHQRPGGVEQPEFRRKSVKTGGLDEVLRPDRVAVHDTAAAPGVEDHLRETGQQVAQR